MSNTSRPVDRVHNQGTARLKLNAVAADAAAAARTITSIFQPGSVNYIIYPYSFTRVAGTAVVCTPTFRVVGTTTDFKVPVTDIAATGAATVTPLVATRTGSASEDLAFVLPVPPGASRIDAVFSVTTGGATDTLTVYELLVGSA